ncbi:uncharacterized protein HKW66_Vig0217310 [Vigna angularis]|uniref:Uncharacterized protein n=1 Tax=Phaseolus angularis TaxID=3914 RepID=A0A8T0JFN5_PHAAN|nr:uncharacterized protein HKW66_Vig0217310 [Vigna angularis]
MSSANDNYDNYSESCDVGESGEFKIDDPEQEEDEGSKFDNCVEQEEIQFVVANDVMKIERLGEQNKDNKGGRNTDAYRGFDILGLHPDTPNRRRQIRRRVVILVIGEGRSVDEYCVYV